MCWGRAGESNSAIRGLCTVVYLILAEVLVFWQHLTYADICSLCGLRPPNPGLPWSTQFLCIYYRQAVNGFTTLASCFRSTEICGRGSLGPDPVQGRSVAANPALFARLAPPTVSLSTPPTAETDVARASSCERARARVRVSLARASRVSAASDRL